jgi:hypothetical protein
VVLGDAAMLVLAVAVNESVLVSAVDAALVVVNVRAACAAVVVGDIAATRVSLFYR